MAGFFGTPSLGGRWCAPRRKTPTKWEKKVKGVKGLTRSLVSTPMFAATESPIAILAFVFLLGDRGSLFGRVVGRRGAGRLRAGGVVRLSHFEGAVQSQSQETKGYKVSDQAQAFGSKLSWFRVIDGGVVMPCREMQDRAEKI